MLTQQVIAIETDQSWMDEFIASLETKGRSAHTLSSLRSDVQVFCAWFTSSNQAVFTPEYLTRHDMIAYRKHCLDVRRVAPSTWNRYLASLRSLFRWAQAQGHIEHHVNIFDGVKRQDEDEPVTRWLNDDEYRRFMVQVERCVNVGIPAGSAQKFGTDAGRRMAIRDAAMVAVMVYAGLREGEVAALEVADIEIRDRSGAVHVRNGKGNKARKIPLNSEARKALQAWLDLRGDQEGPLFTGKRGALGVNGIQERVDRIGQAAKIGHITPHQLRHTFCRRTLVNNSAAHGAEALLMVAKMAGHKRLDTTRRYTLPGQDELADAVERI